MGREWYRLRTTNTESEPMCVSSSESESGGPENKDKMASSVFKFHACEGRIIGVVLGKYSHESSQRIHSI